MGGQRRAAGVIGLGLFALGCGRLGYDPLDRGIDGAIGDGGATSEGGPSDASRSDGPPLADAGACLGGGPFGDLVHLDTLSSAQNETSPSVTADGLLIFFSRDLGGAGNAALFVAERADVSMGFGTPQLVAELDTTGDDWEPGVSADGLEIFFERPSIVYVATRTSRALPFGRPIEILGGAPERATGPSPLDDDHTLLITAARATGYQLELWLRPDRGSPFALARALTELDGSGNEGWGTLSNDGLELFFVDGMGPDAAEIRTTRRASADTSATFGATTAVTELNIGPITGDPELSSDGTTMYFVTDGAPTLGGTDLWSATRPCAR